MCDSRHVNEDVLERTYSAATKKIVEDADAIVDTIKENAGEIMTSDAYAEIDAVGQQIIDVQEQVLTLHKQKQNATVSDIEYNEKMNEYRDILRELESKQEQLQETATRYAGAKAWLENFEASIQNGAIFDATDAAIMKQMVEQIIVYSDRMEVHLKCGATVIQEYVK